MAPGRSPNLTVVGDQLDDVDAERRVVAAAQPVHHGDATSDNAARMMARSRRRGQAGRQARGVVMRCPECGSQTDTVWAYYLTEVKLGAQVGKAQLRLPMRRCHNEHISGWRAEDSFFLDLAEATEPVEVGSLTAGTVPARRRLLRRSRCGRCDARLRLVATGRRLRGPVRMPIRDLRDCAEFDVDLPEAACAHCGARPNPQSPHDRAIHDTAADVTGWLFQLIAAAMPPDRATRVEPRLTTPW
jgi:hypothetical protein